jgi:hypothetical protein
MPLSCARLADAGGEHDVEREQQRVREGEGEAAEATVVGSGMVEACPGERWTYRARRSYSRLHAF